jgi:membrane associated rhomboid family serine protease
MIYTIIIIVITVLVSMAAFSNEEVYSRLILWPKIMHKPSEYYRLLSSGFIHADWGHLFFNMLTLYFFGRIVEVSFAELGMPLLFLILYLAGIVVASMPSFLKNKNNDYYRSLGASGGVSSVLFASVYFSPWDKIYFYFIPIGIPAIIFSVLYLVYSAYMERKGGDNINHNAHFWGAIFGFMFAFVFDPTHGHIFFDQLMRRG